MGDGAKALRGSETVGACRGGVVMGNIAWSDQTAPHSDHNPATDSHRVAFRFDYEGMMPIVAGSRT